MGHYTKKPLEWLHAVHKKFALLLATTTSLAQGYLKTKGSIVWMNNEDLIICHHGILKVFKVLLIVFKGK